MCCSAMGTPRERERARTCLVPRHGLPHMLTFARPSFCRRHLISDGRRCVVERMVCLPDLLRLMMWNESGQARSRHQACPLSSERFMRSSWRLITLYLSPSLADLWEAFGARLPLAPGAQRFARHCSLQCRLQLQPEHAAISPASFCTLTPGPRAAGLGHRSDEQA